MQMAKNDLFIVGDAHQRIYKNKVTLSRCRINVKGRSSQLRLNYRTTEEIRDWAMHILKGIPFDDLDEGTDDAKGYRSLSHGIDPEIHIYSELSDETTNLVNMIRERIERGIEPNEICIVARKKDTLKDYSAALSQAGIRTFEVKRDKTDDRQMNGVRLATMHRVKGLEFTIVFIVAMNKGIMPLKSAIQTSDPEANEEAIKAERCLLYVALTRAKKEVHLTAYGKPSEFLS